MNHPSPVALGCVPRISRRRFLQATTAAVAGGLGARSAGFSTPVGHPLIDTLGLQLATVREPLMTNPQSTVEAIQRAGYRQVELFDLQLLPRLQPVFTGLGIEVRSAHVPPPFITGNWAPLMAPHRTSSPPVDSFEKVVEQAAQYGLPHLVFPFIYPQDRGGIDTYRVLADKLNRAGEVCQQSGIQLSYHHRAFEFQPMEDTSPFQVLMQHTDPSLLHLEVDVFWLSVAGLDPAQFILDLGQGKEGRPIPLLHLQDKRADLPATFLDATLPADAFQPVGAGTLDFRRVLQAAEAVGVQHCFVAQDQSPEPLSDINRSSQYLKGLFD